LESKLPININRQNVCKLGIYNNPCDKTERDSTAAYLRTLLAARFDCYALQDVTPDKSGRYGYCKHMARWDENPQLMLNHIRGRTTLGLYQIALDDTVKWICYDIDNHEGEKGAEAVRAEVCRLLAVLDKYGIPFMLEASGSPNSFHVWILLKPTKTINAYRFSRQIAAEAGVKCEIFPKQKGLSKDSKYGNLVKIPLGINRKTGVRSQFLDPITFEPYTDMVPIAGIVCIRDLPEVEDENNLGLKKRSEVKSKRLPKKIGHDLRPCMRELLAAKTPLEGSEGHEMRVAIAVEAWNTGFTEDMAIELYKDQPDFNAGVSRTNVRDIYSRCYNPYLCEKLRDKCGSFVSSYCCNCASDLTSCRLQAHGIEGSAMPKAP
jgi:hypothetical protein